jgi:hypothetical protein
VEATDNRIGIVNRNWPHVRHGLDLGRDLLDLVIRHDQPELPNSCLDGIPARQPRREVDVARQAKVGRVENLVCAGVVEDGLGVDASLVGEGAEARDGVVERRVDLDSLGN